jgi:hypothetical protein
MWHSLVLQRFQLFRAEPSRPPRGLRVYGACGDPTLVNELARCQRPLLAAPGQAEIKAPFMHVVNRPVRARKYAFKE